MVNSCGSRCKVCITNKVEKKNLLKIKTHIFNQSTDFKYRRTPHIKVINLFQNCKSCEFELLGIFHLPFIILSAHALNTFNGCWFFREPVISVSSSPAQIQNQKEADDKSLIQGTLWARNQSKMMSSLLVNLERCAQKRWVEHVQLLNAKLIHLGNCFFSKGKEWVTRAERKGEFSKYTSSGSYLARLIFKKGKDNKLYKGGA